MVLDAKHAERYILSRYKNKSQTIRRPLKKVLLYTGIRWCVISLIIFTLGFHLFVNQTRFGAFSFCIIVICLMLFTIIISFKKHRQEFEKSSNMPDEVFVNKIIHRGTVPWSKAAIVGFPPIFLRSQFPDLTPYIFSVLVVLLGLGIFFIGCGIFYRIHLLNKYCPYFITIDDRRYYKEILKVEKTW